MVSIRFTSPHGGELVDAVKHVDLPVVVGPVLITRRCAAQPARSRLRSDPV
ncbi:hypothetical protein [Streptomyces sp. NPDC018000]|uniref:hypothetical protein n=1 Tax=Streptomyces sp. NPDC018000 TaxID=3365028 RepID=UPI00379AD044